MSQSGDERMQLTDGVQRRSAAPADVLRPLRRIVEVRVGRPGRRWRRNFSGGHVDGVEARHSSAVVPVERRGGTGTAEES